jgi:hypothetical protein
MCGAVDLWRADVRTVDVVSGWSVEGTLPFKIICRIFSYVENITGSTKFYTAPIIRCVAGSIRSFYCLGKNSFDLLFVRQFWMGSVQKTMEIKS